MNSLLAHEMMTLFMFSEQFSVSRVSCLMLLFLATHVCLSQNREPVTYAMIVGISKYKNLTGPNFAEADAKAFKAYLVSKSGGSVDDKNITTFYNEEAKWQPIWNAMNSFVKRIKTDILPGDRVIYYFAGHGGGFDENQKSDFYFYLYETPSNTDGGSNLPLDEVKSNMNTLTHTGKATVILVFDACRTSDIESEAGRDKISELLEHSNGEILLIACQGGFSANESASKKHGIFTYCLLKGLYGDADGRPKDGQLLGYELMNYLRENVNQLSQLEGKGYQIPTFSWGKRNALETKKFSSYDLEEGPKAIASLEPANDDHANSRDVISGSRSVFEQSDLASRFDLAIVENRLTEPPRNNAVYFFDRIADNANRMSDKLESLQQILSMRLFDVGASVINEDLEGRRNYMRSTVPFVKLPDNSFTDDLGRQEATQRSFVNDYYKRAMEALKAYVRVTPRNERNTSVGSMTAYLATRNATVITATQKDLKHQLHKVSRSIRMDGKKAYLHQAKASLLNEMGRKRDAIKSFKAAFNLSSNWSYPIVSLAQAYRDCGLIKESESYLSLLRDTRTLDYEALYFYGELKYDKQQFDSAILYYKRTLRLNPNYLGALIGIGRSFRELSTYDSSLLYFRRALLLDTRDETALEGIALIKHKIGERDSAWYYYRRLLKLNTRNDYVYQSIGNLMYEMQKNDSAEYYFRLAYKLNKGDYVIPANLSFIKKLSNDVDSMHFYLEKALISVPSQNLITRARIFVAVGMFDSARSVLKRILKRGDGSYSVLNELASSEMNLRDYDSAQYHYKLSLTTGKQNAVAYNGLGNLKFNVGDYDSAAYFFRRGIKANHEHAYFEYLFSNMGTAKRMLGDYDSSRLYFDKGLRINRYSSRILANIGWLWITHFNYDSARNYFKRALRIYPDEPFSLMGIGLIAEREGNYDSARVCYNRILKRSPSFDAAYVGLAKILANLGQYESAESYYRIPLVTSPRYYESLVGVGYVMRKTFRYDSALRYFRNALLVDKNGEGAIVNIGVTFHFLGRFDSAQYYYQMAISKGKLNSYALVNLGILKYDEGNLDSAVYYFRQAYKYMPDEAMLNTQLGNLKLYLKDIDSANVYFSKALRSNPRDIESNLGKCLVLRTQNEYDSSDLFLRKFLTFSIPGPNAYYALGNALFLSGKGDSAVYWYRKVLENDKMNARSYLKIGDQKFIQHSYDSAIFYHQRFAAVSGNLGLAEGRIAYDYLAKGEFNTAQVHFLRQSIADPQARYGDYYYNLACLFARQHRTSEALEMLKKSLSVRVLNPRVIEADDNLSSIRATFQFKELMREQDLRFNSLLDK